MKIAWGLEGRKSITGAQLAICIYQVASLLPLPYIIMVSGYPAVITEDNILSLLFDVGFMAIPRLEALALANLYVALADEAIVYFTLLVSALVIGFALGRILRAGGSPSIALRRILAAFIVCDLVLRLLPLGFNGVFAPLPNCVGWLCQAVCLVLIVLDLRAAAGKPGE